MIDLEVVERLVENAPAAGLAEPRVRARVATSCRDATLAPLFAMPSVGSDVVERRGLRLQQQIRVDRPVVRGIPQPTMSWPMSSMKASASPLMDVSYSVNSEYHDPTPRRWRVPAAASSGLQGQSASVELIAVTYDPALLISFPPPGGTFGLLLLLCLR